MNYKLKKNYALSIMNYELKKNYERIQIKKDQG